MLMNIAVTIRLLDMAPLLLPLFLLNDSLQVGRELARGAGRGNLKFDRQRIPRRFAVGQPKLRGGWDRLAQKYKRVLIRRKFHVVVNDVSFVVKIDRARRLVRFLVNYHQIFVREGGLFIWGRIVGVISTHEDSLLQIERKSEAACALSWLASALAFPFAQQELPRFPVGGLGGLLRRRHSAI